MVKDWEKINDLSRSIIEKSTALFREIILTSSSFVLEEKLTDLVDKIDRVTAQEQNSNDMGVN